LENEWEMKQRLYYLLREQFWVRQLVLWQVGHFGGAAGGAAGGYAGKAAADEINKRGYGMKVKGRRNSMVRPASDVPTFSPYATLYSPQNHPFMPRSSFQNGGTGELIM